MCFVGLFLEENVSIEEEFKCERMVVCETRKDLQRRVNRLAGDTRC